MDRYRLFRLNRDRNTHVPVIQGHNHPTYRQIQEQIRNQSFYYQIRSDKEQLCEDCQNDCYDQINSQYLLYLFSKLFPQESACLSQNKKYQIRPCSIDYSFRRCKYGTYHLWNNGKRVPMCKEAYRIAQYIHGHQHRLPIIMKTRIQTDFNVHYESIADFVEQFPYHCQYCSANLPKMKLNSPIWKQLYSQINNQEFLSIQQQILYSKKYNLYDCYTSLCKRDKYQNKFQQARYCLLYKTFPPQKKTESNSSYQRRVEKLLKLIKKLDIKQCSQGTYHLWMYQANKRVPMIKQKQIVAEYLHGEQHLNQEEMGKKLRQIKQIYLQDLETSIKQTVRNCQKCQIFPKLKLQTKKVSNLLKQKPLSYLFNRLEPFNPQKQQQSIFYKRVKQLIQNFPFPSNINEYYEELKNKLNIPDKLMQQIEKQEFWVNKSVQQMIMFLETHNIHIKTIKQEHKNEITQYKGFLIYTDQMKYNYQKYGDTINIDFIEEVVEMRTFTGQYYLAILITGLDQNFSNLLFAVCLIQGSDVTNHMNIYEFFFEQMGGFMPENIVTGNNIYAESAIKSLIKTKNLETDTYINWFWVIDKLKIQISKQQDRKRLMETITELLVETAIQEYKEKISKIKSIIGNINILSNFDFNRHKYCLCMIKKPRVMIYSMSTNKTEQLLKIFQKSVVMERGLGQFVLQILEFQKHLELERKQKQKQNRKEQGQRQGQVQEQEQTVKHKLSKNISDKLCLIKNKYGRIISSEMRQLYIKSSKQIKQIVPLHNYEMQVSLINRQCKIDKVNLQNSQHKDIAYGYHVISSPGNSRNQCNLVNKVIYLVQDEYWECSCRFQYAAGLPCHHLLPILQAFSASIQYYICEKWLNLHHQTNYYQLFPTQGKNSVKKSEPKEKKTQRKLIIDFSDLAKPKYSQYLFHFKPQYFNEATFFQKIYKRMKNNLALIKERKNQRQNSKLFDQNEENYQRYNQIANKPSSSESHNQNWHDESYQT